MIIGDSSALIALAVLDRLEVLDKLFKNVYVPKAVFDEVTKSNKAYSNKLKNYLKDKIVLVKDMKISKVGLGVGELEAITLYKELNANLLLIDDKRAKKFAKLNEVNTIGSIGVLILAKEENLIKDLKSELLKLQESNIFLSQNFINLILKEVNEA